MGQWIDFKALRESIDFKKVLDYYHIKLKIRSEGQYQALCPLPTHTGEKSELTMSVNLRRAIWHCHGCKQGGNMIDFVARLEGLDPEINEDIRKAGLLLAERFLPSQNPKPPSASKKSRRPQRVPMPVNRSKEPEKKPKGEERLDMPRVANGPLDFILKNLDPNHPHFTTELRLTPETVNHFGLGYCSRGLMAGRIAIPLHDGEGRLIGYAGLLVDENATVTSPQMLYPADRVRQGVLHTFRKSILLYNAHALQLHIDDLIVVEDIESTWALWQAGLPNIVSFMGQECSPEQAEMVAKLLSGSGQVSVFTASERSALNALKLIAPKRYIRWVRPEAGMKAIDCTADQIRDIFA